MSAFICTDYHISILAQYAEDNKISCYGWQWEKKGKIAIGRELLFENYRSYNYRYKQTGTVEFIFDDRALAGFLDTSPAQMAKAVFCLIYQSCEHPSWEESAAFQLLDNIKDDLLKKLPGYKNSMWGIDRPVPAGKEL